MIRSQGIVFPYLEELNFAFNLVTSETGLMYPLSNYQSLNYLIITGNPFAIAADQHMTTKKLEMQMNMKNGQLVNDSMAPPTFVRSRMGTS
jgi:hypothetical protein